MSPLHIRLAEALPRLTAANYRETSPASWTYNCIAWAANVSDAWWWPVAGRYWPPGVPFEETLPAFIAAFAALGYVPESSAASHVRVERIALYASAEIPTHAARQLPSDWWTSKLGPAVDIEHETADAVAGGVYGEVVAILVRNRS